MFSFLGGGREGGGGSGGGGVGGRGGRKRWWSLGGGTGVGGLLDASSSEDAAVVVIGAASASAAAVAGQVDDENGSQQARRGRGKGKAEKELTAIEQVRQENLRQNQAFLQSLGIGQVKAALKAPNGVNDDGQDGGGSSGGGKQSRKRKRAGAGRKGVAVATLEQVARKWAGREEQIRTLARLLPVSPAAAAAAAAGGGLEGASSVSPLILVHGPSGAGKTGVLRDLLLALRLPHAYVRGPEHPTARSLYGAVAAAWIRFIEAQARALGMEGLGYVAGADDVDRDYAEEEALALKEARREERRRRQQEERQLRRREREERAAAGEEGGEGTKDEMAGASESEEDTEEDSEDEDEEEDEEDRYWHQTAPLASGGNAGLVPLNRVGTASGLLHLLRSWRGFQGHTQPSSASAQAAAAGAMTPFVIVLDGADRLPRGAAAVQHELAALPAMLAGARGRGGGFLGASSPLVALTVVLVSEHPHVASGALEAGFGLPVPFPAYTKKEASAILLRSLRVAAGLPSSSSSSSSSSCRSNTTATAATASFEALASAFSSLLVGALYASTRDVREMRRMAALLSHTYLGPLLSASAFAASSSAHDKEEKENHKEEEQGAADNCAALLPSPTALLERIQPLLARATQHCLHLPAEPLEQPTTASAAAGTVKREGGPVAKAPTATRLEMLLRYELPALTRFLLVAAYLASNVAPDTDLFLFASSSGQKGPGAKKKRLAKQAVRQERQAEGREAEVEKEGARSFSLERLLSIFTCLLASSRAQGAAYANSTGTTELFAQINALVHHRLLTRVHTRGVGAKSGGPPPELTAAKFKCNVGYDLVLETARGLEIELNMYLDAGRVHAGTVGGGGGVQ